MQDDPNEVYCTMTGVTADLAVQVFYSPHVHPTEVGVSVNCRVTADEVLCPADEFSHLGFILEPACREGGEGRGGERRGGERRGGERRGGEGRGGEGKGRGGEEEGRGRGGEKGQEEGDQRKGARKEDEGRGEDRGEKCKGIEEGKMR